MNFLLQNSNLGFKFLFAKNLNFIIITIKEIIDDTKCRNPYEMTEDQLVNELTERGKDTKGSREQLVERLLKTDKCNVT